MSTRLFVGSLPWATNDEELRSHFASAGEVTNATVMIDRETGRSRGFGFVEMADEAGAQKAIDTLNGSEIGPENNRRAITVDFARPRRDEGDNGTRGDFGRSAAAAPSTDEGSDDLARAA